MKTFYVVLIVFLLIIVGIVVNAAYINNVAKEMNERIDHIAGLPCREGYAAAVELGEYWHRQSGIVGLSVSYTVIDRVSESVQSLVASAEVGDIFGHRQALALLRDTVEDVRRLECFSLGNLF